MKNYFKYLLPVVLAVVLIMPITAKAATTAEVQAQINAIMQQIQALQQQVTQLQAQQGTTSAWCHTFNTNLKIGDSGNEDVHSLQNALRLEGFTMSDGEQESVSFGESTAAAVTGFQEKYKSEILTPNGLSNGTGYVGPSTRAKLNQLYGCISCNPIGRECASSSECCSGLCINQWCEQKSQSITVLSPNGGESWQIGNTYEIKWNSTGVSGNVDIYLNTLRLGSGGWAYIAQNVPNTGSYIWNTSKDLIHPAGSQLYLIDGGNDYSISIISVNNSNVYDASDSRFSMIKSNTPSITVLSPNGGESWQIGQAYDIRWTSQNLPSDAQNKMVIEFQKGSYLVKRYFNNANDGIERITIPSDLAPGIDYKINVLYYYSESVGYMGSSDAPFSIVAAQPSSVPVKIIDTTTYGANGDTFSTYLYIQGNQSNKQIHHWVLYYPCVVGVTIRVTLNTGKNAGLMCDGVNKGEPSFTYYESDMPDVTWDNYLMLTASAQSKNPFTSQIVFTLEARGARDVTLSSDTKTITLSPVPTAATTHCERCSVNSSYQWVSFDSTDSTCATVLPAGSPVTRTCNYSCPGNVGNSYPPDCRAAVGELRGKILKDDNGNGVQDNGEVYLRDPSISACTNPSYVQSGIAINYSGPATNGSTPINQCSSMTGDPIYSLPYLPVGNYNVSVTVPSGWQATAARADKPLNAPCSSVTSCSNVPINSGAATVVIFSMRPTAVGALAPSGQYSASILENMKITLDQIQKAINDLYR